MPGKRKKILFGADFREEGVTRKGKPRTKKHSDAENTQKLNVPGNSGSEASVKSAEASPEPKNTSVEDDWDDERVLTDNQARIVSIVLFFFGILFALAVLIPGEEGWEKFHNMILGLFGAVSFLFPAAVIYSSVIIAQRREKCGRKIMVVTGWGLVLCVAIQVIFVGKMPVDGFSAYYQMAYRDGKDFIGGGAIGSIVAFMLLKALGRIGAAIVSVLMIMAALILSSHKKLTDFLGAFAHPFRTLSVYIEKFNDKLFGEYEYVDDEEEEEEEYVQKSPRDMIFDELEDDAEEPEIKPAEPPKNVSPAEQREIDEFSRMFDIPLPEDEVRIHSSAPETESEKEKPLPHLVRVERNEASEQKKEETELDAIISKAVEKKARQDRIAAGEDVGKEEKVSEQMPLYILPGLDLLTLPSTKTNSSEAVAEMNEKAVKIVDTFKSFGVEVNIRDIYRGPSITRYEIQPGVGVKVSKIRGLEDDIALSLAAQGVRLEAPVPGKAAVGIEVPNINKDTVTLREILSTPEFRNAQSKLAFAVGKDITGNAIVGDITKMPHVIIAGTTGSGKSVCTRSIIMSILYKAKPEEVKIILIDPKVVEFKVFEGIPHLLIPIVTEAKKAAGALNWAVNEMMRRYNTFAEVGANDLKSYNELSEDDDEIPFMPQIVVFIDELADLMLVAGKEVEDSICRLAQMGRAAGMHLVVATQRPTTDVITGLIKANIPSRIALSVMSQVDSRTIIDMAGADKLLGNGDMLYMPIGTSKPVRIQGCFASSKDISETLSFIRAQATGEYDSSIVEAVENFVPQTKNDRSGGGESSFEAGSDEDYVFRGAEVAVMNGQISTTLLQRKLKLGYARASRIMDELEERGIIGPSEGSKPRKVLMSQLQFEDWKSRNMPESEN